MEQIPVLGCKTGKSRRTTVSSGLMGNWKDQLGRAENEKCEAWS